jgi:hypothetical protein
VTRPAVAPPLRTSILKTACCTSRPVSFVGHDALEKFAGDLRATHPHFVYTPHGEAQALHNGGILAWGSGPRCYLPISSASYDLAGSDCAARAALVAIGGKADLSQTSLEDRVRAAWLSLSIRHAALPA